MPMNRDLYPSNWEKISQSVRNEANWICEDCGRPCRKPGVNKSDFLEYIKDTPWHSDSFEEITNDIGEHFIIDKPGRFTLTVSHRNHNPLDCRRENLQALCSVCHLKYDAPHHAQTRRANKRKAQEANGQMSLFTNN